MQSKSAIACLQYKTNSLHFAGEASQKLVEAAQTHAGNLTVVASGPLTNIAHALQLDPHLVSNGMLHAS